VSPTKAGHSDQQMTPEGKKTVLIVAALLLPLIIGLPFAVFIADGISVISGELSKDTYMKVLDIIGGVVYIAMVIALAKSFGLAD
jgi:hypothetical protein